MKKLTDILKEAGIEMGKVYTDKDKPPFQVNEKKDNVITVQGVGKFTYDTLKKNVAKKLKDLTGRNKRSAHYGVGKNQFNMLSVMWSALQDYEENQ